MLIAIGANGTRIVPGRGNLTWQSPDRPAPTIRSRIRDAGPARAPYGGMGNLIEDDRPEEPVSTSTKQVSTKQASTKPPYQVPSMARIKQIPWNGFTAASTFSGCGGSSLGYRLAGFRVLWASEFIPAAQDTYRANAASYTHLDTRDIRTVTAADMLTQMGLARGELDLLDGSPPCASFSTSGKRQDGWGKVKKYSDSAQRTDDLFYEFARLVEGVQPRVFVAENVSGLVKGSAKGYFIQIMRRLRECGYQVDAKLLDAQWLGVPQARQRLIFVGVRNDLRMAPRFPRPLPYRYSVREVLGTAQAYVHDTSGQRSGGDFTDRPSPTVTVGVNSVNSMHYRVLAQGRNGAYGTSSLKEATVPSGTIGATPQTGNGLSPPSMIVTDGLVTTDPETGKDIRIGHFEVDAQWQRSDRPVTARRFTLGELRRICGFPDDFALTGSYEQRWERLGRAVPPVMMSYVAATVRDEILSKAHRQQGAR